MNNEILYISNQRENNADGINEMDRQHDNPVNVKETGNCINGKNSEED